MNIGPAIVLSASNIAVDRRETRVLGAHKPVPESEVQSEIVRWRSVVDVVMGHARYQLQPRMIDNPHGKHFDTAVANGIQEQGNAGEDNGCARWDG